MELMPWSWFPAQRRGGSPSLSPSPWSTEWMQQMFEMPWRIFTGEWGGLAGYPSVDVVDAGESLIVRADLPGVDPANVDVRVLDDSVVLKGEMRQETKEEKEGYYRSERRFGSFYRTIPLPTRIKPEQASASLRHGVLEIRLPKAGDEEGHGRRLKINIQ
ncbi:MAG: Hsp20/alpha crystallin family protein [Limnochordales bacterium]|nr:Hsp20/alpha crystallin family protein [Limnochordales bacterium]